MAQNDLFVDYTIDDIDFGVTEKLCMQEAKFKKYLDKLNLNGILSKDKQSRATAEQVLDPKTMMILFKIVSRGLVTHIEGCVSTGKEANVYYGPSGNPETSDCAVKVFKTSILTFKDRDRYVEGEFRFRRGYCKGNPRKMVQTWAEKEFRNLQRIALAQIRVPKPILLRGHVIVMEWIGTKDGVAAPRLKDCLPPPTEEEAARWYKWLACQMRIMYHESKLVHADLSEYNVLVIADEVTQDRNLVIIDVSQSVEHDHPRALQFLRMDVTNVTKYFGSLGPVLSEPNLFRFITDPGLTKSRADVETAFDNAWQLSEPTEEDISVFRSVHIPRTAADVTSYENDYEMMQARGTLPQDTHYQDVIGLNIDEQESEDDVDESGDEDDESISSSGSSSGNEECEDTPNKYHRPRNESPTSRRLRKAMVKEEAREKRKTKVSKVEKKKKIKKSTASQKFAKKR